MVFQQDLPWPEIHDYLAEVCTAESQDQFCNLALKRITKLIPYDANGVFGVIEADGRSRIQCTARDNGEWLNLFHQHYWQVVPDIGLKNIITAIVNWGDYRHTEYVTDFNKPQGIWRSMGIMNLGRSSQFMGGLVIHRSSSEPEFNEREQAILSIIQPHLSNLYHVYTLLAAQQQPSIDAGELMAAYRSLTRREAEICSILCQGLNTKMISSMLIISPRTVYKHVENIFEKLKVKNRQELIAKINRMK